MNRLVPLLLFSLFLPGCAQTLPVVVMTKGGQVLRGTNTVSMTDGSFSVTDGKLTCSGSYNPLNNAQTITVTLVCNDGRTGIAIATRDSTMSGGGHVQLSDGTDGTFAFGAAAAKI